MKLQSCICPIRFEHENRGALKMSLALYDPLVTQSLVGPYNIEDGNHHV